METLYTCMLTIYPSVTLIGFTPRKCLFWVIEGVIEGFLRKAMEPYHRKLMGSSWTRRGNKMRKTKVEVIGVCVSPTILKGLNPMPCRTPPLLISPTAISSYPSLVCNTYTPLPTP